MDRQYKANLMEKLHVEYIEANLNLKALKVHGADFLSERHIFEMKSKTPEFDSEGPTKNVWWPLSNPQIEKYERKYGGMNLKWLFVHCFTRVPLKQLGSEKKIRESIFHRDIFIAPWEVYKPLKIGNAIATSKAGPYRILSRKHLMEMVNFSEEHELPDGKLYIPEKEFRYILSRQQ